MGKKIDITHVVRLDDSNYERWKLQITTVLEAAEVLEVVNGTSPQPPAGDAVLPAWRKKDAEARAIIVPTLDKNQTNHVFKCTTAKAMFDKLKQVNSDSSVLNKQYTWASFHNYKVRKEQTAVSIYLDLEEIARNLNDMGENVADSQVIMKIVSSLPDNKFLGFRKAWQSVAAADQTMVNLLARLRMEDLENKQAQNESSAEVKGAAFFHEKTRYRTDYNRQLADHKKKSKCHNCGGKGHWKNECRKPVKQGNNPTKSSSSGNTMAKSTNATAFIAAKKLEESSKLESSFMWYSDSGASQHVTGVKEWFKDFTKFTTPQSVALTNKQFVEATGSGCVQLEALVNGQWEICTLSNVLYIPQALNLFSESTMAQKGYKIIRDSEKTIFYDGNGIPGPEVYYYNKLYVMKFRPLRSYALSSQLWHCRLGHVNIEYIRNAIRREAITGISANDIKEDINCEDCHYGKETRKPFPRSKSEHQTLPGEKLHGDLAGKMPIPSLGGSKYFLLLKDDSTGFRTAYFLKEKSQAAGFIQQHIKLMETQTGRPLKVFMSDNGTEFVNQQLGTYFTTKGIIHQTSAAYCPESNSRIEREIRTIKESARTMMIKSGVPEFLWAEAVATAVYIHNRLTDRQSPHQTAFERIFNKKPFVGHLRIFGCTAFAQIPKEQRKVWDTKCKKSILVGYDGISRNYRLYNREDGVFVARNVSFKEDAEEYAKIEYNPSVDKDQSEEEPFEDAEQTPNEEEGPYHLRDRLSINKPDRYKPEQHKKQGNKPQTMTFTIKTQDGLYTADLPEGNSIIKLPSKKKEIQVEPQTPQVLMTQLTKESRSYKEATNTDQAKEWTLAMEEEMKSLLENETWTLVKRPVNKRVLSSRWVYRIKPGEKGIPERFKARLVIRGNEQESGIDYEETFASVCRYESIRLLLAIAVTKHLKMKQFDVKTAFLNGQLEDEIFMEQPEGFQSAGTNWVCLLKRSLYGLKQASRCWQKRFTDFIRKYQFSPTSSDPCVYKKKNEAVFLCLYVDDGLIIAEDTNIIDNILEALKLEFELKIMDVKNFVGIEINQNEETGVMTLTQKSYIKSILQRFKMQDCKPATVPMKTVPNLQPISPSQPEFPYQELIGSLLFLTKTTRPDIAYATAKLSQFMTGYGEEHWTLAKEVLRYLKGTIDFGLEYSNYQICEPFGFTDSDYAGDKIKSVSGYAFFIDKSLISWNSQKQPIVALSSTEAEYIALANGAKEAMWLRKFLAELGLDQNQPTTLFVDNQSSMKLALNPEFHKRSKHIDVRYHYTRELIEDKQIQLAYVPTEKQAADLLTKPLSKPKFEHRTKLVNLVNTFKNVYSGTKMPSLLTFTLIALLFVSGATTFKTSNTVLWRPSKGYITTGHQMVILRIKMVSPCIILKSEIVHGDLTGEAILKCDDMYEQLFLNELEKMCPVKKQQDITLRPFGQVKHRGKRFISLLVGILIISIVTVTSIAIAGVTTATINSGKISDLQEQLEKQEFNAKTLERNTDTVALAVSNFQSDFNRLLAKLENVTTDYVELKRKQIGTSYAISYITNRLLTGKLQIQEAARLWKDGKMSDGFLDYLNITLPCKDNCPLKFAIPRNCHLTEDRSTLFIEFNSPLLNRSLHLLEADPFRMMYRTKNKTCDVDYNGPKNMIVSNEQDCALSVNVRPPSAHELLLAPGQQCLNTATLSKEKTYFTITQCKEKHSSDYANYIQIKAYGNSLYVYCYGSKMEISGKEEDCSEDIITLPITATFKVNGMLYNGSQMYVDHIENIDPTFSMKINWHLRPSVNFTELNEHPLVVSNLETLDESGYHFHTHPMTWTTVALVVMAFGSLAFGIYWFKFRKQRVGKGRILKVKAKRIGSQLVLDEIKPSTSKE